MTATDLPLSTSSPAVNLTGAGGMSNDKLLTRGSSPTPAVLAAAVLTAAVLAGCSASTPTPTASASERDATSEEEADKDPSFDTVEVRPQVIPVDDVKASGSLLAPLPVGVTSFGAATTEGAIYLLGGYSGTPHAYSKEGQSTDVLRLALEEGAKWTKVSSLSQGLQGLAAVEHDGRLCHFGGNHANNEAGTEADMTSVRTARCLDVKTNEWTDLPDLPQGRSSHGAAVIGDIVYVVGGWSLGGSAKTGKFAKEAFALDLKKPDAKWETMVVPFSRRAVGVAATEDQLVIVGGMSEDGRISTEVDIYDIETKKWVKGPKHPGDAFGVAVAARGDTVYAAGREGIVRALSTDATEWKDVRPLALARFFQEMRVIGDDLVVVGGIGGMHTRGRTRVVERIPLDGSLAYGQLSFTSPSRAKNRQGLLLQGEEIYLFGGNLSLGQHDFGREHFTSEGWKFDLATLQFVEAAPYPHERQSMQTMETEDGGISLGGFGHEPLKGDDTEAVSQGQTFSYSWEDNVWSPAGVMPRGRTQFGLTRGAGKFWVFGGLNYDPKRKDAFQHDQTVWVSNEDGLKFEKAEVTLPGPRRAFAAAELNGKYYLIGGMKEGFQLVEDCLEFDFEQAEFATIPCPTPRLSGDLISAAGKLYLVGGSVKAKEGIEESRSVEMYDPESRKWEKLDFDIPFSTRHMRALSFRDQILLLSTHFEKNEMTLGIISPAATTSN